MNLWFWGYRQEKPSIILYRQQDQCIWSNALSLVNWIKVLYNWQKSNWISTISNITSFLPTLSLAKFYDNVPLNWNPTSKHTKTSLDFEVLKDGSRSNPLSSHMGLIPLAYPVYFMPHLQILFCTLAAFRKKKKRKRKTSLEKYEFLCYGRDKHLLGYHTQQQDILGN